ncbi:hypothetical protein ABVK25_010160 [Lepraria finkii]|uniref:Uncharacterized protein n=1 Tax=Lepraria finkii TaxID=1340010 RepID=A0ABR4AXP4_9LECA
MVVREALAQRLIKQQRYYPRPNAKPFCPTLGAQNSGFGRISGMEDIFRQARLSTALSTSTWQAAGTGESAQDEQCFGYAQEYQYPAPQMPDSSSQYKPVYP